MKGKSSRKNREHTLIHGFVVHFRDARIANKDVLEVHIPRDESKEAEENHGRNASGERKSYKDDHHNIGIMILNLELLSL
jgi:hypothetical protein